tara:strand:+ start:6694 stop:6819 length:126 start_codon:yes stop_codon:yes gene_type:complete
MIVNIRKTKPNKVSITSKNIIVVTQQSDRIVVVKTSTAQMP